MTRLFAAALVLFSAAAPVRAGDFSTGAVGTTGSEFLTLDLGARGIGMGGAFSAAADDANAMYWNPAGLARVRNLSATVMHNSFIAGINYDYAAVAQRLSNSYVVGGAIRYLDAGSIPGTDVNGNSIGSFHPRSYVYELGVGQTVPDLFDSSDNILVGITGRAFNTMIDKTASGFAFDAGAQYRYERGRFPRTMSLVVQNVGQGEKYDQTRGSLPMRVKVGGAINFTDSLLATSDLTLPRGNQPDVALGAEYEIAAVQDVKLAIRSGIDSQMLLNSLDGFRGWNFGFGISALNFFFDYAFAPMGILGNTHRISLTFNWDGGQSAQRYRER